MAYRAPLREQAYAFRELATLVSAGITLKQALDHQVTRPMAPPFRAFFRRASDRVGKGEKLSVIMRDHAGMFSDITVALIEAGEQSGRLDKMLTDIAEYLEREVELRNMISRETFYAKILVSAVLLIPAAARAIIAWLTESAWRAVVILFQTLMVYLLIGGLPLLAFYLIYRRFAASQTGRNLIDQLKLAIPVLGVIIQQVALAKFCRAFAALYEAGISVPDCVRLSADACGNRHLASQFHAAAPVVEQGIPLSEALGYTRLSNSLVMRLLETGEQTGNVDAMMDKAAQHLEDESRTRIHRAAVMIVPVVIIIMGIIVGIMIARFYLGFYMGMMD